MAKVQKSPHKSPDLWGSIVCNNKGVMRLRQCGGQLFAVASGPNPRNFPVDIMQPDVRSNPVDSVNECVIAPVFRFSHLPASLTVQLYVVNEFCVCIVTFQQLLRESLARCFLIALGTNVLSCKHRQLILFLVLLRLFED